MPQPLFMEVTDLNRSETRIVGLAWISDILRADGTGGAVIISDKGKFVTVESYDTIKAALGIIQRIA